MARMTMRTREAPMEWERERDRDLPNIFNTPPSLDSDSSSSTLKPRTATLRSFSSDPGQLQRESSFTSQRNQSSFTTGWGSPSGSFRQDSEPLSEPGHTTLKHGSFESRPRSPGNMQTVTATSTSSITPGVSSGAIRNVPRGDVRASSPAAGGGGPLVDRTTSFDMKSLGDGILDKGSLQQSEHSSISRFERTSSGSHLLSNMGRSDHLRRRSNTTPSFWGEDDGDEAEEDQDIDGTYDGDDSNHHSMSWSIQRRGQRSPQHMLQTRKSSQKNIGRSQPQLQPRPQPQPRHHAKGRIWSENVDLPYILSGYIRVFMNSALVLILIYIMTSFVITIQNDVSLRSDDILHRGRQKVEHCKKEYELYKCDGKIGPKLYRTCEDLEACIKQPEPKIGRATVAAETVAIIVDVFVNTMSYKTMGFVIVIVFGTFYFSNHAISTYQSKHIMHHQHSIMTPAGPPTKTNSESRKRSESYNRTGAFGSRPISRETEEEDGNFIGSEDQSRFARHGSSFVGTNDMMLLPLQ